MNGKNALDLAREAIADIMNVEPASIEPSTRLVMDLGCESIDFMEMAVKLSRAMGKELDDEAMFLRSLRLMLEKNRGRPAVEVMGEACPWLSRERAAEIAAILEKDPTHPPLVTVGDMTAYLEHAAREL